MGLVKPLNPHRQNRIDYVDETAALILQRRHQILVHSYLYYHYNMSLISDSQFDAWAKELVQLQADNPQLSEKVFYYRNAFRGFDGTTGFDLPYTDPRIARKADLLIKTVGNCKKRESRRFKNE
jgi:hypothetical protein